MKVTEIKSFSILNFLFICNQYLNNEYKRFFLKVTYFPFFHIQASGFIPFIQSSKVEHLNIDF